jgi:hypothetical protein
MQTEQYTAIQERMDKLGFPRTDEFRQMVKEAVARVQASSQAETMAYGRDKSDFRITIAQATKDPSKIYVNSIEVNGKEKLRFPIKNSMVTMKAMENAANNKWVLLKDPKNPDNNSWLQVKDGEKKFISTKEFNLVKEGQEILGYKLTADDVKAMEKGNNVLTNDCKKFEKGSNVPVGDTDKTVALYADPAGNRIGYKQLDEKLELKKEFNNKPAEGISVAEAVAKAKAQNSQEETPQKKSRAKIS